MTDGCRLAREAVSLRSSRIRPTCVTFDLWETLFLDTPEREQERRRLRCEALYDVLSKHELRIPLDDILRGFDQSSSWLIDTWSSGKQATSIEQVRNILNLATNGSITLPDNPEITRMFEEAYRSAALNVPPELDPETITTMQVLRERGYKIGLICNSGRSPGSTLRKLMEKLGILRFFDETVFSDEVGPGKPDKRIFFLAAEKLGVEPRNVVHIGDNPEHDIWGAKEAGMMAFLLERTVPEGFSKDPYSLFALSGKPTGRLSPNPDRRISSLKEALNYLPRVEK